MSKSSEKDFRTHASDALRRARKLPVGAARNDLRQLAQGLLTLRRLGLTGYVKILDLTGKGRPGISGNYFQLEGAREAPVVA
jgi:hypothetical protein